MLQLTASDIEFAREIGVTDEELEILQSMDLSASLSFKDRLVRLAFDIRLAQSQTMTLKFEDLVNNLARMSTLDEIKVFLWRYLSGPIAAAKATTLGWKIKSLLDNYIHKAWNERMIIAKQIMNMKDAIAKLLKKGIQLIAPSSVESVALVLDKAFGMKPGHDKPGATPAAKVIPPAKTPQPVG